MSSNIDLIKDIGIEANAKGVDTPETDGKNNAQLAVILKDLKAAAPAPLQSAEDEDETEVKKPPFYIKDGKSLTNKRGDNGMLKEGEEIKPEWIVGGMTRIKELIKLGVVAKG